MFKRLGEYIKRTSDSRARRPNARPHLPALLETMEPRTLLSFTAHINFQPTWAPTPSGYLRDTGEAFSARGNGQTYGWTSDVGGRARYRNLHSDLRYDTMIPMQEGGSVSWNIAVPAGLYRVHIVAGDSGIANGTYRISAEGVRTVNGTPSWNARWVEGTAQVQVDDGRLTISNAPGAVDNRLAFIDIVQLRSGTTPVDPPGPPVTPTTPPARTPAAPSRLAALKISGRQVNLTWQDNANNEKNFSIERSSGKSFRQIALVSRNVTSFRDKSVKSWIRYTYRVRATNNLGHSAPSNAARAIAPPKLPATPAAPENLAATALSTSQINLTWTDQSTTEVAFVIERSQDAVNFTRIAAVPANTTHWTDAGLATGARYTYRVRAMGSTGDSPWSNLASCTTQSPDPIYDGPITITAGGTYIGNWQSLDPYTPAVLITTTEPVIIENSNIRSRSDLIRTGVRDANLTIRNTRGYGLNPNVYGRTPGRFLEAEWFDNIILENNYLEQTSGIYLLGYQGNYTAANTVRVVGNSALNIDGRKSDGNGGFLDFNVRQRLSDGATETGWSYAQFLQLDKVAGVGGIEIAWNQVINEPGRSRVEDNISVYKSSGTRISPLLIHDNYIQGAYTIKPWLDDSADAAYAYDWSYSGGGIMLGDGSAEDLASASGFIQAYRNQVISTSNYGIAVANGHDIEIAENRVVSAGVMADGRAIPAQNVGIYIWDADGNAPRGTFFNNGGHDNVVGWRNPSAGGGRNDWWLVDAAYWLRNTNLPSVGRAEELAERTAWDAKLASENRAAGPML